MGILSKLIGAVKVCSNVFSRYLINRYLINRYCRGKGLEIGPGTVPYSRSLETVYVDKFLTHRVSARKYVTADASSLPFKDNSFSFVISSHCLEHCPNTLKVLEEWKRVILPNGVIFLILPHGERTFDRGRQLTTLEHHVEDQTKGVDESDSTHWEEFAEYSIPQYDHGWTNQARNEDGSWNFEWIAASGNLHYHVWTQNGIIGVLKHLGCRILVCLEELIGRTDSFVVVACIEKD